MNNQFTTRSIYYTFLRLEGTKLSLNVRDESSASNADVPVIPSQLKVTHQILSHWEPFRDLKASFAVRVALNS